ncbi:transmembrane protein 200C-like isoform X2 [Brachyistius frenatus]|uniref:transmembrane protein 200C-like isoform X2 n=1 Tax=Brachyistius frenatus TaxID=100188 RepID=UPI0037E7D6AA
MIATGGLLRINARRQDSLRSKPRKAHTHKRKSKKRRSEVVVVKGKLKLCSVSGLVAVLGVLVLLVGGVMAALGYWPRDGLFFTAQPQEGTAMASVSSSSPAPAPGPGPADDPGGDSEEDLGGHEEVRGGGDESFKQTETINETTRQDPRGFLQYFLDRYLYSDRLKVFGPLIMGIGIFLFICANAVLHENRDKKTKVINLRDIYSTVIDLHSLRKPNSSSGSAHRASANPLNGLVNYVQSKSLETKPRAYPASLLSRTEGGGEGGGGPLSRQPGSSRGGGGGGGGGRGSDEGGDGVFSIYHEQPDAPHPSSFSSHRLSLPQSFSPSHLSTCCTSLQKEALSSFTLPLRRPRPPSPHRRHSARAWTSRGWRGGRGGGEGWRGAREGDRQEEEVYACPPPPVCSSTPPTHSLQRGPTQGSQALLLLSSSSLTPSHLSLSSLSLLLSSSTPAPPCRRRSLPTGNIITCYIKLTHREDKSFKSTSSHQVTSQKYSNRDKLRMISHSGGRKEEEEEEEAEEEVE